MGSWQASVIGGLAGGAIAVVIALLVGRGRAPGGGFAAVLVLFVLAGAVVPALVPATSPVASAPEPKGQGLDETLARLGSHDRATRLAAIDELARLMVREPAHQPVVVAELSRYVRQRARPAADPGCTASGPDKDVQAAVTVLGERRTTHDGDGRVDLHGACLAGLSLTGLLLPAADLHDSVLTGLGGANADLRGADLTGATLTGAALVDAALTGADLTGADLTRAVLAGSDLADALLAEVLVFDRTVFDHITFSDETTWPPEHEPTVLAASSFDTTSFVCGELALTDPA